MNTYPFSQLSSYATLLRVNNAFLHTIECHKEKCCLSWEIRLGAGLSHDLCLCKYHQSCIRGDITSDREFKRSEFYLKE